MKIHELHYSNTNTYLIEGESGKLLFDTGWAGTFPAFCSAMGELGIPVQDIQFILISHFHPDHMGIAQEIADQGATIMLPELQRAYVHMADSVFKKEGKSFIPIRDEEVRFFSVEDGRSILKDIGIDGEIIPTPGHSDDSISLSLDDGSLFVGDLNPLYELELHKGTGIEESWNRLLRMNPKRVYYGHARSADISSAASLSVPDSTYYSLVSRIMKLVDKGCDLAKIQKKTGADIEFIEDVTRMYLTHQNIGVQGILDRLEIKNR